MTKEILAIPEQHLQEVIDIIRAGIFSIGVLAVSQEVKDALFQWCDEEEEYLSRLSGETANE